MIGPATASILSSWDGSVAMAAATVADEAAQPSHVAVGAEGRSRRPQTSTATGEPETGRRLERLQGGAVELVHHREHGTGGIGEAGDRGTGDREAPGAGRR